MRQRKSKAFEWRKLSNKQLQIFSWWCESSPVRDFDGIIADGAIRSGKTVAMAPSFVIWAMTCFDDCDFAICGKTVSALRRNVVNTLLKQMLSLGYEYEYKRSENLIIISKGTRANYFYTFGGKDESSQDLIQGMTLAGILFDEVALMPQSFVEQGIGRCSVENSKVWFNCNPKDPTHWFKKAYVDDKAAKRYIYLHFTQDDNLTLSEKTKEKYRRAFKGVFYDRNILGLWVTAEGKIYIAFGKHLIIPLEKWNEKDESGNYLHPLRREIKIVTMGVDFGGSGSSHAFNLTGYTRGFKELITLKERRIKEEIDPSQLESEFLKFAVECKREYPQLTTVYADSAEQVLIRGFRRVLREANLPIAVKNAKKGEILDRIYFYSSMMSQKRYYIISNCTETYEAFETAVWDEKKRDVRLDDGTTNIDSLDAQEYSSEPFQNAMIDMGR